MSGLNLRIWELVSNYVGWRHGDIEDGQFRQAFEEWSGDPDVLAAFKAGSREAATNSIPSGAEGGASKPEPSVAPAGSEEREARIEGAIQVARDACHVIAPDGLPTMVLDPERMVRAAAEVLLSAPAPGQVVVDRAEARTLLDWWEAAEADIQIDVRDEQLVTRLRAALGEEG